MAELITMMANVPADWDGTSQITVQTAGGPMSVAVPAGVGPGQSFNFQMAAPAPVAQPVAMAQPMAVPQPMAVAAPQVVVQMPAPQPQVVVQMAAPQPMVMGQAPQPMGGQQAPVQMSVFGRHPQQIACPTCKQAGVSRVAYVPGIATIVGCANQHLKARLTPCPPPLALYVTRDIMLRSSSARFCAARPPAAAVSCS